MLHQGAGLAHGADVRHQLEGVVIAHGDAVDVDHRQGQARPLGQSRQIRPVRKGGDARAGAAADLFFGLQQGLAQLRQGRAGEKGADEQATFAAHRADVAVVAAYGLILPQAVLDAPRHGCLNVHGSILPRWRGAAPVQRAILAGDDETGVTIMQMERGLDTGPMRAAVRTPVDRKTAGALTAELAALGAGAMIDVLADLPGHPPVVQPDHGVTYAAKIDKAESRLDFTQPAAVVERSVRAFAPAPGAFFELDGERYRVLAAEAVAGDGDPGTVIDAALTIACGAGALRPSLVQRAGRPAMDTPALLRGRAIAAGTRLA